MEQLSLTDWYDGFEDSTLSKCDEENRFKGQLSEEERLNQAVDPLLKWFEKAARTMPWRSNPEPYWVWISEIMLQQTRVEAVRPYFHRFIEALPDVTALAQVKEERLLKLWEGLGYYSRARNLKKAAIICVERYNAMLPDRYEQLLELPGIGSYTAGAIASIAYEQEIPAVDGNVLRVISRLLARREDITKQSVKKQMEQTLIGLMQQTHPNPRMFTQALMELGALVCLPNGKPHCEQCPWQMICLARIQHLTEEIPIKKKKAERKIEQKTVFLVQEDNLTAIQRRPSTGLLAGLYELPSCEGYCSIQEAKLMWEQKLGCPVRAERINDGKHIFSHIEWHMQAYLIHPLCIEHTQSDTIKADAIEEHREAFFFVTKQQLKKDYALPNAFKAWKKYLTESSK